MESKQRFSHLAHPVKTFHRNKSCAVPANVNRYAKHSAGPEGGEGSERHGPGPFPGQIRKKKDSASEAAEGKEVKGADL